MTRNSVHPFTHKIQNKRHTPNRVSLIQFSQLRNCNFENSLNKNSKFSTPFCNFYTYKNL